MTYNPLIGFLRLVFSDRCTFIRDLFRMIGSYTIAISEDVNLISTIEMVKLFGTVHEKIFSHFFCFGSFVFPVKANLQPIPHPFLISSLRLCSKYQSRTKSTLSKPEVRLWTWKKITTGRSGKHSTSELTKAHFAHTGDILMMIATLLLVFGKYGKENCERCFILSDFLPC